MLPQLFNGVEPYAQLPHSAVLVYTLFYKQYVGKDLHLTVGIMFLVKAFCRIRLHVFNLPTGSSGCPFNNLFTDIATDLFISTQISALPIPPPHKIRH